MGSSAHLFHLTLGGCQSLRLYSSSHVIRWAPNRSQAYGVISNTCHPAATLLLTDFCAEGAYKGYLACRITGKYQNKCKPSKSWFRVEVYASEVLSCQ